MSEQTAACNEKYQNSSSSVRVVVLNLPEDEGAGLGFRLTRTLWDPYPWVHEVTPNGRADAAGLRPGDCLLQVDGKDLLGTPVGQVATLIRGDGGPRGVSLLAWNCGVDPQEDPDLLWSCGGGARGERARRALSAVLRALACCVCASTATKALSCARSHVYCDGCWNRLQRCALCREPLPAKDSPYARNLVAEQVFEAIATEYDIKDVAKKTPNLKLTTSICNVSPSVNRRLQHQTSLLQKSRKTVQFGDRFCQNYASDPNLSRTLSCNREFNVRKTEIKNLTTTGENSKASNTENDSCQNKCSCQSDKSGSAGNIPQNVTENDLAKVFQHKLITRLRPASSLADLQHSGCINCGISKSLNSVLLKDQCTTLRGGSLSDFGTCHTPVFLMVPTPVHFTTCDHDNNT